MNLSFFLHPRDREWLAYGLVVLLICAWTFAGLAWRKWSYPAKMARLIARNPSFAPEIQQLFAVYEARRFSSLARLVGLSWLSFGCVMVALGYVTDTGYELTTFHALLFVFSAAMVLTGVHLLVNSPLFNTLSIIEDSDRPGLDIQRIRSPKSDVLSNGLVAASVILPALYLLSCLLFGYPYDLYHLAQILQKWGSQ